MNETQVTVVGNLVADVNTRRLNNGAIVANFRVASTGRRFDQARGRWVDGDTLYIDVRCWRDLAENAARSLTKGDPVVVTGKIFTRDYEHEGRPRSTITLEARSVAADLAHCSVVLTRTRRSADDGWGPADRASVEPAPRDDHSSDAPRGDLVSIAPGDEG